MRDAGVLVSGHSLTDLTTATSVQVGPGGERTITDGPYAEAREVLGGYDLFAATLSLPYTPVDAVAAIRPTLEPASGSDVVWASLIAQDTPRDAHMTLRAARPGDHRMRGQVTTRRTAR